MSDEVLLIKEKNSGYRGSGPQFEPVNINLNKDFKCDQCSKILESQGLLNSHLESHRQRMFKCETCDIGFKDDADLNNHIVVSHKAIIVTRKGADEEWNCNECDLQASTAAILMNHLREIGQQPSKLIKDRKNCSLTTNNVILVS